MTTCSREAAPPEAGVDQAASPVLARASFSTRPDHGLLRRNGNAEAVSGALIAR